MSKIGIFNPYQQPKPKKKKEPLLASVRLDGDSYILEFFNVALKGIPERLGDLIHDIQLKYHSQLIQNGIDLHPTNESFTLEEGELSLPTPKGHLTVYVGTNGKEVDAYRRIGYALCRLPIEDILTKHNTKIITRMQ